MFLFLIFGICLLQLIVAFYLFLGEIIEYSCVYLKNNKTNIKNMYNILNKLSNDNTNLNLNLNSDIKYFHN